MSGAEQENNSIIIKEKHIHKAIVIISFIITLAALIVYIKTMPKFKLHEIYYKPYMSNEYTKLVRFDSTETVKLFSLQKKNEENSYVIKVSNLKGVNYATFKIKARKTKPNWTIFNDVNHDGFKDILIFYQRGDSLFQSIFDQHNKKIISSERLILIKPKKALHLKWYINLTIGGIFSDSLKNEHLIFSVFATGAVYPRSVYDYNLSSHKIERQLNLLASPYHVNLFDINKDGKKEIIVSATSTATIEKINDNNKYDFFHSWLIVLNQKFKPLFILKKGPKFSSIVFDTLSTKSMNYIVAAYRSPTSTNLPTELYKIDSTGNVVNRVVMKSLGRFHFFVCENKSIWFSFGDSVKIYDANLKIQHRLSLPESAPINIFNNFSFEGNHYVVGWANGSIYLFNSDYELVLTKKIEFSSRIFGENFTLIQSRKGGLPYFMISGKMQGRLFVLVPNKISYIMFFIFLALWGFLSLFLFYAKIVVEQLFIYYQYFVHSSSRSSNMIILLDNNKKIKYMNKVAKQVLCPKGDQCKLNEDFSWLKQSSRELFKFIDTGINTSNESTAEFTISSESQILRVRGTFTPFKLIGTYLLGYYCSLIDLSKAIEAERAKVYSHSIQKVAHEIKTPLNSLLFIIKSLEFQHNGEEEINSKEVLSDIKIMEKEIKRIKMLTNNLLKFANLQKPHFQVVNIEKIIVESLNKFNTYRGKGVEFKISGFLGTVFADEFQIKEALQVLIENSIDAMKANGKIEITISKEKLNYEDYLKIIVADEGMGIPEEIRDVLFDPYVTTKLHGTGMGLAIAQKIVEDHGSKLVFETGEDGTIFSFYLKCVNCGEEG